MAGKPFVRLPLLLVLLLAVPAAVAAGEPDAERLRSLEEQVRRQGEEIEALRARLGEPGVRGDLASEIEAYLEKASDEDWFAAPDTLRAAWKNGLRFESSDREFELQIGGRLNFDLAWFDADREIGEFPDQAGFRRIWIAFAGRIHDRTIYKAELGFEKGTAEPKDVYVGLTELPVLGELTIGNQKEPLSLEWLTSAKYLTFMERALPLALVPDRQIGVRVANRALDGRLLWSAGVFSNSANGRGSTPENVSLRIAGIPWLEEKGESLLLVGVSASRRDPALGAARYRERPEANFADRRIVDTGTFSADGAVLLGMEAALVRGPFSLQGEVLRLRTDAPDLGDPVLDGWYVFASWFPTGEHREFRDGVATRIRPARSFLDGEGGTGALEIALRYSTIDLSDAGLRGGSAHDWTLAANWYLNPVTRVRMNLIRSDPDGPGTILVLMFRFEIDF